ncbi:MAG: Lar family restriction alleviation protein [Candidatus Binatia bacterium]
MTELAPCPFCGSANSLYAFTDDLGDYGPEEYFVKCDIGENPCGGKGPHRATKEEAIKAWNTRAGPQIKDL